MKIYIPAPGRTVPTADGGTWPEDGRPVDPISPFETRMVRDGDLIEKPEDKPAGKGADQPKEI